MQKYWAANKQVQTWGFRIIKFIVLGSFAFVVCYVTAESLIDFLKLSYIDFRPVRFCSTDCSPFWMISLFILLVVSSVALLFAIWKAPKGFWLNFLLVFWGFFGLMYLEDGWSYSWQPKVYSWTLLDGINYTEYVNRNLLIWMWAALGVAQIYLPKRVRKYVIGAHCSILGIMMLAGVGKRIFFE